MFSEVKSYWQFGNSFCSIELVTTDGKDILYAIKAKKKKDEFLDFQFHKAGSFSELSEDLTTNQHCYLIINTNKVLIKEIPFEENNQKALTKAFPSLSTSEFYYEILKTKTKCFVAICRRDDVDQILKQAAAQKIEVLGFSLGFSSLPRLIPLLNKPEIITARQMFIAQENAINSFNQNSTNENTTYKIEDIEINSNFLIALSGLFNYLSFLNKLSSNFIEENEKLTVLQQQKNFFRKGLFSAIGVILISLLLNFFLFNSYYKQVQTIQQQVQVLKSQKENFTLKSSAIESKERIVNNILNSSNSKSSFYINRIVAYRPGSILFNEIIFHPLKRVIRIDKPIEYTSNELQISGESNDKTSFSNWIETLENFEWIQKVTVTNYGISKENNSSFSISIIYSSNDSKK